MTGGCYRVWWGYVDDAEAASKLYRVPPRVTRSQDKDLKMEHETIESMYR